MDAFQAKIQMHVSCKMEIHASVAKYRYTVNCKTQMYRKLQKTNTWSAAKCRCISCKTQTQGKFQNTDSTQQVLQNDTN